jgi:hypothetical protein
MSSVRKKHLHEEAVERQAARAGRSASEQIARLDTLLGKGKGAVKERARLAKEISSTKKEPKAKKSTEPKVKQKAKERRASKKSDD